jgi:mono/diheme cytochrome c family protein
MKKILKWTAVVLAAFIGLTIITGMVLYFIGKGKLTKTYPDIKVEQVKIPADTGAVARGKHISIIWACTRCHGDNLGGTLITHDPIEGYVPLLGTIPASNLTSGKGGIAGSYTDADWVRAIRYGVKPDGRVEIFMYNYSTMSDRDLGDLISYLKQITPVNSEQTGVSYGPILPIFSAVGLFKPVAETIDHNSLHPVDQVPATTKEYGKYLSALCIACHGSNLVPPLRIEYKQDDFMHAVRTGILPNGKHVDRAMPPKIYGELNDNELTALWLYFTNPASSQTR